MTNKMRIDPYDLYDEKINELNDAKVLELLKSLPSIYEDGGIEEVKIACCAIYNAIQDFTAGWVVKHG